MSKTIKLKWGKEEYDVDIEDGTTVEIFKTQVWTLTNVPVDRQKYMGFPGGALKDADDLCAKAAKLKPGAKVTLMGTAEGGELKEPVEKTIFEEDLTPEEKAKILKTKKIEVLPAGIKNLGNTCYMNSVLQSLNAVKDLRDRIAMYDPPPASDRDVDAVLTAQFRALTHGLTSTTESIVPLQFVMALRQRFPRFAEMQNGGYAQQDADECLKGLLQVLSNTLAGGDAGNMVDELFGFKMNSKLKCLECDEEVPTESEDVQRGMMCHLGTQTDPVTHIFQGIQLSLKEHIEKNSPVLGRNAQYEKSSGLASLPKFMVVQYARFGYKAANDWAGTQATKVKLIRKCSFQATLDLFDCATDELKKKLQIGRVKRQEQEDEKLAKERARLEAMGNVTKDATSASSSAKPEASGDVEMADADKDVEMKPSDGEIHDTGYFELIAIVSHKGRTADGGHYVAWTLHQKSDGKKDQKTGKVPDDRWLLFDDETVTAHDWKELCGIGTDLQGGKADTQIAYINIYRKVSVQEQGKVLGTKEEEKPAVAAAPAASS